MSDLLVVGAGPAGLTAAWRAARSGLEVRVVERAGTIGGLAASITVGGQRVDLGSHRLHPTTSPPLFAALQELLGDDLQQRVRHGRLRLADRWLAFPLRVTELARSLPRRHVVSAATASARRSVRRVLTSGPADETLTSYADVVLDRFGPAMLQDFYGPYARKLWGVEPEQLAARVARHRISAGGPGTLVRRAVARQGAPARTFFYPRHGYGQIVDALASAAIAAGATIETSATVQRVRTGADGVDVVVDGRTARVDRVVWTGEPHALADALDGTPAGIRDDLAMTHTRAMVIAYLVLATARYTEFDAHYLPSDAVRVTRISEPKNYRDGPDPAGSTVLCAEIPCDRADDVWQHADELGPALATEAMARSGLPPAPVADACVVRLPSVYPVHTIAAAAAGRRVDDWAAGLERITVLGRQGLRVADNLHQVMAMGWDAGELAASGWEHRSWNEARARYRRHVVTD